MAACFLIKTKIKIVYGWMTKVYPFKMWAFFFDNLIFCSWQMTENIVFLKWCVSIIFFCRCCCFFKRKKKKSGRQKWLAVVQCSPEREAVTLLRATSHSNSRDSVLNNPSNSEFARYPTPASVTWWVRGVPT